MGDPRQIRRKYNTPKHPWQSERLEREKVILANYALKNKKEIWKTLAKVNYFRTRAKALAKSSHEEQQVLFKKLQAIGLKVSTIAEVLDLKVEDLLNRRLPTIIVKKGLANTPKQARQFVTHKKVMINNQIVNSPSYLVPISFEESIQLKIIKSKEKKPEEAQEQKGEEQ